MSEQQSEQCPCCKALWIKFYLVTKISPLTETAVAKVFSRDGKRHFWQGEDPDPEDCGFLVYNLECKYPFPNRYSFEGQPGDVGLACFDDTKQDEDRYRIVCLTSCGSSSSSSSLSSGSRFSSSSLLSSRSSGSSGRSSRSSDSRGSSSASSRTSSSGESSEKSSPFSSGSPSKGSSAGSASSTPPLKEVTVYVPPAQRAGDFLLLPKKIVWVPGVQDAGVDSVYVCCPNKPASPAPSSEPASQSGGPQQ